ncbi:hypothetical protein CMO96_02755 [Candidatus Woesebacteria bacterium]|nr:hypothetical protein [Candidatus Woesebacteria bacterium]|tara:strand:+ start:294 stop:860 length:567 start_codon:yes stop_codon:yes gene_type:complete
MDLKEILKGLKLNEPTISTILGALVVLVVIVLIINYFRGEDGGIQFPPPSGQIPSEEMQDGAMTGSHKVAQGEHLWAIAEKYYKSGYNWVDIAEANNLVNPSKILVGQELAIPEVEARAPTDGAVSAKSSVFGSAIQGDSHTVVEGDHLWGVAVRAYGDGYRWVKIAQENNLVNPNVVEPGQILQLKR